MLRSSLASLAILASVLAAPASADNSSARHPGSALVFPIHRSGPGFFTVVSVTNTNVTPATPMSFGGSTLAHFEYVNVTANPLDPFQPLGCTVFDRVEFLTPADTLSVLTSCHNAYAPGGQEGYLVVSAQDPSAFDRAWRHDELIGSELVINGSGGMYAVNAITFAAGTGAAAPGDATDADADGRLDFDGVEYDAIPDMLYIDSFVALLGSHLTLLNLTGGPRDLNRVELQVWNDNEFPLSSTILFNCWFDQRLTSVSPLFSTLFLASLPHDPDELDLMCDGSFTIETGWARIDSAGVFGPMGGLEDTDGALLGCITAGPGSTIDGGHLLWESTACQVNGEAFAP